MNNTEEKEAATAATVEAKGSLGLPEADVNAGSVATQKTSTPRSL